MPVGKPLEDLVVVVPGILGSRLARIDRAGGRHEIWGTSAATLAKNLLTFGRRIKQLAISPDADPDAPGDGIAAIGLISDLQVIPGFLSIAGYDGLMARLRRDNSLRDDQVVGFAYDWRLSNRVAAVSWHRSWMSTSRAGAQHLARKGAKREDGQYRIRLGKLPPGLHHVQIVRSSPSSTPVDEISDTILIYTEG
jgi:hypothetical protein